MTQRSARWHIIYSLISTIVEEAGIAILLLVVLPVFGINVPLWGTVAVMTGFAILGYIMYLVGHPTVVKKALGPADSFIGLEGVVENAAGRAPMVLIRGELWKAVSADTPLAAGERVIVTAMDGLTLTVKHRQ